MSKLIKITFIVFPGWWNYCEILQNSANKNGISRSMTCTTFEGKLSRSRNSSTMSFPTQGNNKENFHKTITSYMQ